MASINDYTSGKVVENVKLTLFVLKFVKIPSLAVCCKKIVEEDQNV